MQSSATETLLCANMDGMRGNANANPATHFGRQINKERVKRGWTIREFAAKAGISAGHLSRIENGRVAPTAAMAAKMDGLFPERDGWFADYYEDSQEWTPPGYRHWAERERAARNLKVWTVAVIHGLVQTPEYARAHLETLPGVPAEVVSTRLAARLERQNQVFRKDAPPSVAVLVDEPALYRCVGSAEIMIAQMDHLLSLAMRPNVVLQVVPAVAHAVTSSEVLVTDSAAYTEHQAGGCVYTEEDTVAWLGQLLATLQAESYRASESLTVIERVKDLWERGESPLTAARRADLASK